MGMSHGGRIPKVLAISRLYLSNFLNVQSSWVTQGLKVCQMGLRFGGNDAVRHGRKRRARRRSHQLHHWKRSCAGSSGTPVSGCDMLSYYFLN